VTCGQASPVPVQPWRPVQGPTDGNRQRVHAADGSPRCLRRAWCSAPVAAASASANASFATSRRAKRVARRARGSSSTPATSCATRAFFAKKPPGGAGRLSADRSPAVQASLRCRSGDRELGATPWHPASLLPAGARQSSVPSGLQGEPFVLLDVPRSCAAPLTGALSCCAAGTVSVACGTCVERRRERDRALQRHPPVRRPQAQDAAVAGRHAHRACMRSLAHSIGRLGTCLQGAAEHRC